jgi:hypothetical protein
VCVCVWGGGGVFALPGKKFTTCNGAVGMLGLRSPLQPPRQVHSMGPCLDWDAWYTAPTFTEEHCATNISSLKARTIHPEQDRGCNYRPTLWRRRRSSTFILRNFNTYNSSCNASVASSSASHRVAAVAGGGRVDMVVDTAEFKCKIRKHFLPVPGLLVPNAFLSRRRMRLGWCGQCGQRGEGCGVDGCVRTREPPHQPNIFCLINRPHKHCGGEGGTTPSDASNRTTPTHRAEQGPQSRKAVEGERGDWNNGR